MFPKGKTKIFIFKAYGALETKTSMEITRKSNSFNDCFSVFDYRFQQFQICLLVKERVDLTIKLNFFQFLLPVDVRLLEGKLQEFDHSMKKFVR